MKITRRAFSLVELLTVIAVIGILAAILIPVVGKVRASARQTQCASNLRQTSLGALLVTQETRGLMPLGYGYSVLPDIRNSDNAGKIAWSSLVRTYLVPKTDGKRMGDIHICPGGDRTDRSGTGSAASDAMGYALSSFPASQFERWPSITYHTQTGQKVAAPATDRVVHVPSLRAPNRTVMALDHRENGAGWPDQMDAKELNRLSARHGGRINLSFYDGSVRSEPIEAVIDNQSDRRWTGL